MSRSRFPSDLSRRSVLKTAGCAIASTVAVGQAAGEEDDSPVIDFDIKQETLNPKRGRVPTSLEVPEELAEEDNDAFPEFVFLGHAAQFEKFVEAEEGGYRPHDNAHEVLATPDRVADFENPHQVGHTRTFRLAFPMEDIDLSEVAEGATTVEMAIGVPDSSATFGSVYYVESATHRFTSNGYSTSYSNRRRELGDDEDDEDDE